jgi:adenosylcobyric acid synthase
VPWLEAVSRLPSEDAVVLDRAAGAVPGRPLVACPILPRIANFDDLDPLRGEPDVDVVMVPPGMPIPAQAAMIVLPGSKATIADMAFLRQQGWDIDILAHHRRGGTIMGICGGYQMLGRSIADPLGIEGSVPAIAGLGLLDVETRLGPEKALRRVSGQALGHPFEGYEMHMGETTGSGTDKPFARLDQGRADGAISADGRVLGTYCHGLLGEPGLRGEILARIGVASNPFDHAALVETALDDLAGGLEAHLDIDGLLALAQTGR